MRSGFAFAVLLAARRVYADDASYRTLASASNPDWMMRVPDDRSLAAISIPGTHDTSAITGGAITQTQENFGNSADTHLAQLNAGIRALDIRARVVDGDHFAMHHGAVYQNANFDDVINKIGTFLSAHPAEAVLIRLKAECTGSFGSCTDVEGQSSFVDIFDKYRDNSAVARERFWAPSVQRGSAAGVPTMGEIRGKIVFLVLNGHSGERTESYGLSQFSGWNDGNSQWVQDNYNVPNTGAIATKRDQVRRFLDANNVGDQSNIFVNFASGASIFAQPQQVAGGGGGTQGVNPFLLTYLGEGHPITRTGITYMDFPGGGLIDKIISYNPPA